MTKLQKQHLRVLLFIGFHPVKCFEMMASTLESDKLGGMRLC